MDFGVLSWNMNGYSQLKHSYPSREIIEFITVKTTEHIRSSPTQWRPNKYIIIHLHLTQHQAKFMAKST